MTMTIVETEQSAPASTTAHPPMRGHTTRKGENGGEYYEWWGEDADYAPTAHEPADDPQASPLHDIIDDEYVRSNGIASASARSHWVESVNGIRNYVKDSNLASASARAHWTETVNGITSYIKHASAAPATDTATAPALGHGCIWDYAIDGWSYTARMPINPQGAARPFRHFVTRDREYRPEYDSVDAVLSALDGSPTSEPAAVFGSYFEPAQPVIVPANSEEQAQAAIFTATVWQHIVAAGGPRPTHGRHTLIRGAFGADWLAGLALPGRATIPEGQSVTLTGEEFTRYTDREALAEGYQADPRTWIFERAHHVFPWLNHAAAYLGKLSSSPLEVLAAVFDSRPQDEAPGEHFDTWYSVIVQMDGAKRWTVNHGDDHEQFTTRAGDVLLIPEGLVHAAATPDEPGHSRHIQFTLCRHTIASAMPLGMP